MKTTTDALVEALESCSTGGYRDIDGDFRKTWWFDEKLVAAALALARAEQAEPVPEGCTPKDAQVLRQANHGYAMENQMLREALKFYADRDHFNIADRDAWDTVSGEPQNFWCDDAGTATVEDGTLAAMALRGTPLTDEDDTTPPAPVQAVEPHRPDILEKLTYHALERDDLTLDDCLAYLAKGWYDVRGRTERQMVLQLTALLAAAPPLPDGGAG